MEFSVSVEDFGLIMFVYFMFFEVVYEVVLVVGGCVIYMVNRKKK